LEFLFLLLRPFGLAGWPGCWTPGFDGMGGRGTGSATASGATSASAPATAISRTILAEKVMGRVRRRGTLRRKNWVNNLLEPGELRKVPSSAGFWRAGKNVSSSRASQPGPGVFRADRQLRPDFLTTGHQLFPKSSGSSRAFLGGPVFFRFLGTARADAGGSPDARRTPEVSPGVRRLEWGELADRGARPSPVGRPMDERNA